MDRAVRWLERHAYQRGRHDRAGRRPAGTVPHDVAFGGADCSQLYVVSARHSLSMDAMLAAPLSGRLFRVDTGLKGQATLERRNV